MNLELHHVGCLVAEMEPAIASYRTLLGEQVPVSDVITIEAQQVQVCFVETAPGIYLELVAPLNADSTLARMQRKKGIAFYHLAYKTANIEAEEQRLIEQGYHLVTQFHSEAFGGLRCSFLYTPELHLIELIEK